MSFQNLTMTCMVMESHVDLFKPSRVRRIVAVGKAPYGILVISYQLKLIKMRTELATLNHSAVPFLSRAASNLCWYYCTMCVVGTVQVK